MYGQQFLLTVETLISEPDTISGLSGLLVWSVALTQKLKGIIRCSKFPNAP